VRHKNKFDHVAVCVTNLKRSISWYCNKYENVSILYEDETWALLKIEDVKVAFILNNIHPPHIAFSQISNIPPEAKMHRDGSYYIYDKDPDGNVVERIWWPDGNR